MKFLRIGSTKLKVVVTKEEYPELLPERESDIYDKTKIKEVISDILRAAREKCGFDIEEEKVLVQVYPDSSQGYEIFITKLVNLSEKEKREVLSADNVTSCERATSVFRFDSFENLLLAARAVKCTAIESDLYYNGSSYYIKATENSIDGICCLLPLYEFAERVSEVPIDAKIERGRLIFKGDSLKKLAAL